MWRKSCNQLFLLYHLWIQNYKCTSLVQLLPLHVASVKSPLLQSEEVPRYKHHAWQDSFMNETCWKNSQNLERTPYICTVATITKALGDSVWSSSSHMQWLSKEYYPHFTAEKTEPIKSYTVKSRQAIRASPPLSYPSWSMSYLWNSLCFSCSEIFIHLLIKNT